MAVDVVSSVEQLTEPDRSGRGLDLVDRIQRLGGAQVVGTRAHSAQTGSDLVHLVDRPADAELLETAKLGHLPVGVLYVTLVVQEDLDLAVAFQPGDGIDGDPLRFRLVGLIGDFRAHSDTSAFFSVTFLLMMDLGMVNA